MTHLRSEDMIAGLIALALVPIIALQIRRGLQNGTLPIGRGHVRRAERSAAFHIVLAFYAVALLLIAAIAADLLLNLGIRDRL